jgi:hypothetical protein
MRLNRCRRTQGSHSQSVVRQRIATIGLLGRCSLMLTCTLSLCVLNFVAAAPSVQAEEDQQTLDARRKRLEQMSQQELAELRRKKERFDQLSDAEQARLRKLHADLQTDPQADQLQQVLVSYNAWLQTLTAAERAELMSLPMDQRVRQIKQLQQEQRRDVADRLGTPSVTIPAEDATVVLQWMDEYLKRSRPHLETQMPQLAERLAQTGDAKRHGPVLLFALMQSRSEAGFTPPALDPADIAQLAEKLSPASRQQLNAAPNPKEQLDLILKWCRAAFFRQFEPTREELEKYYRESLTAEDREWLDAMPRQRFQQTLRSMYFRDRQVAEGGRGGFLRGQRRPGEPPTKRPAEGKGPGLGFPPLGPFGPGGELRPPRAPGGNLEERRVPSKKPEPKNPAE